jgi:hypothetical protein
LKVLVHETARGETLQIQDEWERFVIDFSIYYPLKTCEILRINGDIPEMGNWNKGEGPKPMLQSEKEITWLTGAKVKPWVYQVRQRQNELKMMLTYKYSIYCEEKDYCIWEREPSRYVDIQKPELYLGELGNQGTSRWPNVEKVFIVNGKIVKADANFVGGLSFNKIAETGVFIGPYPQLEEDVKAMADAGVTGVFNV